MKSKPKIPLFCKVCGNMFYVQPYRTFTAKTCSKKCHQVMASNSPKRRAYDGHNNTAENLCVITQPEHVRIHHRDMLKSRKDKHGY